MISKYLKLSIAAAVVAVCTSAALVQAETILIPSKGRGEEIVIKLDPSMAGKTIAIYAAAPKNNVQTVDVNVKGIGGEVITGAAFTMTGKQSAQLAMLDPTNALAFFPYGADKSVSKLKIAKLNGGSSSSSSSSSSSAPSYAPDPNCGCLTDAQIEDALEKAHGALSRKAFCELVKAQNPVPGGVCEDGPSMPDEPDDDGAPSAGSVFGTAYVPFNACLKASKPGVIVKIDLSGVDAASLDGGEITAKLKLRAFQGSSRAVLKESDGQKFPGWISLTAPVGGGFYGGGDLIEMVNWKGKRIAKVRRLKVGDLVYYDGFLSRTPLGGNLSGGQGTFHVSSRGEGYSFCAKFIKQRQQFNGYRKLG